MKKLLIYSVALLSSVGVLTSCVGDLETQPLDKNQITADRAFADPNSYDQYVSYAYGYFSLVSPDNPGGADIAVDDAGQSEFTRMYTILNELSTDALFCTWGDDYVAGIQFHKWNPTNTAVKSVYTRGIKAVALCNQFLDPTVSSDSAVEARGHADRLADVRAYRAEMRLLRAIYYEILMDLFGNPPVALPEHLGAAYYPEQMDRDAAIGRAKLFEWIEKELLEVIEDENLPAVRVEYPRLSKGAAYAVLARMYLNAEVYTGTARWEDAKKYADKCIDEGGYKLNDSYVDLFRQDNTTNGAQDEFIIAATYDTDSTQSWGGTTHYVYATVNDAIRMPISKLMGFTTDIYRSQWNGYTCSSEFVKENFDLQGIDRTQGWGYSREASDKRAFFYGAGFPDEVNPYSPDMTTGWACVKWLPLTSDNVDILVQKGIDVSSADFPIFRLAEMYLISAEAEARMKGGSLSSSDDGYALIKTLRKRANGEEDTMPLSLDLEWILKERTRELYWEGHRRVDLIRYNKFTTASYAWPYKAGIKDGNAAIDDYRKIYPILSSDKEVNPNLVQNPGY